MYMYITQESSPILYWIIVVLIFGYVVLIGKLLYSLYKTFRDK
jgi:hypothetical protein